MGHRSACTFRDQELGNYGIGIEESLIGDQGIPNYGLGDA